jgi:carboxypeptidase Q
MRTAILTILTLLFLAPPVFAEEVDLDIVHRIKSEAFYRSRVMEYMHLIADRNGPRMSGSPGYRRAAEAALGAFREAGIERTEIESWGPFGRGWDWTRVAVQMKTPHATTLVALPADFSPGTNGPVSGEVIFVPFWEHAEYAPADRNLVRIAEQIESWKAQHKGQLRGKIVMLDHPKPWKLPEEPVVFRFEAEHLADFSGASYASPVDPVPYPKLEWPLIEYPIDKEQRSRIWDVMPLEFAADRWSLDNRISARIFEFLVSEGVTAMLIPGYQSRAAVLFQSDHGSYDPEHPLPPPSVALMPEHYNRIHRLLERGETVALEIDVEANIYPDQPGLNVMAEIPGSARNGELVMLGAHFDSWHGATGATDNASGSAVVMEVMRILKALDVPLRRTVRAGLWDAEEQCLCGSRGYVRKHFADPVTMELKPAHAKLSAYFNLDNGSGKIRGVYLQQNDMARPIFEAWMAPFADLGVTTATIVNTSGTDHLSFNAVGLPGFQFVQDPLDYDLNTHHSIVDDVGHVSPGDLMQAAAVMATAVYHAAQREGLMPRKPLPAPLPPKNELPEILRD